MDEPSTRIVDHIVHLSPPGQLKETVKQWEGFGFTVVPGGQHTGGLTENALVAFQDGVYIELISFTHPLSHYPPGSPQHEDRKQHYWANKQPGFIDFAFLGNAGRPSIAAAINARADENGSGVRYAGETPGGRTRPDGRAVQWLITAPIPGKEQGGDVRGKLPFFCGDLTPRDLRVPHDPKQIAHPNTSLGIASVQLLAASDEISHLAKQITTVVGSSPTSTEVGNGSKPELIRWSIDAVHSSDAVVLELRTPRTEEEQKWIHKRGSGIHRVQVQTRGDSVYARGTDSSATQDVQLVSRL